ncbi:Glyoxalase/Bleomycin resistance protein/Dioxygenase superfamily protein [Flavobacterium caeni]|uniref:Glyoxalase/Bleomycin resistance protein/Dioxygenase superfamily protein n=1 Tax=Flavobacterium caeni TaxID=490189 RepID=A0A1G5IJS8_9FLAO|nr:Glyoxalase/Bleomycin resistance protein/Dioxygenase superfamily protein [Flavobacterium caeni]
MLVFCVKMLQDWMGVFRPLFVTTSVAVAEFGIFEVHFANRYAANNQTLTYPLKIKSLHHTAIIASDYAKSKKFYTEILGLEIVREVYR